MRFRQLEVFHAVYLHGSISAAARALGVSQPSVSKTLHHSEDSLGIPLFQLSRGRLIPTDEAHALMREAGDLFERLDTLQQTARNLAQAGGGHIRLGIVPSLALDVVLTNLAPPREADTPWLVHQIGEQPVSLIGTPSRIAGRDMQALLGQEGLVLPAKDSALRAALRQDPDVIMIGEIRDLETAQIAVQASLTGHLVLATLHSRSATQAVERLVDVFPSEEKSLIRNQLSLSLLAVITQTLCMHANQRQRVAAHEVLYANPAVRHLIREQKTAQLPNALQTGAQYGMPTLSQALQRLQTQGLITAEEAAAHAP